MTGTKLQRERRPTGHRHNVPHRFGQPEGNPKRGARDTLAFFCIWHTTFQTRGRIGIRRRELIPSHKPPNLLIMSNIQDYINACTENADMKAQALRELANVIGNEVKFAQSSGSQTILRLCKESIKKEATDLQNLVRTMAEQLEQERAEAERMKRLYEMARSDYREMRMKHAVLGTELDDLRGLNGKEKQMEAQAKAVQ